MHLLSVVPLARMPRHVPQVFSYTHTTTLPPGALVRITVGKRTVNAIILMARPLSEVKAAIKKLPYRLKSISGVLSENPILFPWQLELARWISAHFYEPLSLVMRTMIPTIFERRKTMPSIIAASPNVSGSKKGAIKSLAMPFNERLRHYQTIINSSSATLILAPDQRRRSIIAEALDIPIFDVSLKSSELFRIWNDIRSGKITAITGTRSAIMAPFPHLNYLIIEQESSDQHASWDQHPKIDLRRIGEWLATQGTTVTLGDSFPTLERTLRYDFAVTIPLTPAQSMLVDLRTTERDDLAPTLSHALAETLEETLQNNQRAILYVARRGAATFILCQDCGFHLECPHCSVPLVLHTELGSESLRCHHCGYRQQSLQECPTCRSLNIRYAGTGTQTVEHELRQRFPDTSILRLDADTMHHSADVASFKRGILLGTDLLLQHPELPSAGLVAAASIETLLHLPNYTSTERLLRTLLALREKAESHFIIQTYTPEATAITALLENTTEKLIGIENASRKARGYPPYAQLILCRLKASTRERAQREGQTARIRLEQQRRDLGLKNQVSILGPAPAFIERTHDQSRENILLKWHLSPPAFTLSKKDRILRKRLLDVILPSWEVIIDPISLL